MYKLSLNKDKNNFYSAKIKDICHINSGTSPEGSKLKNKFSESDLEFHQGCTHFGSKYINESNKFVSIQNSKKEADIDDILMSVRAPVGSLNICKKKISIGRGLVAIKSKNTKFTYFQLLANLSKIKFLGEGAIFDGLKISEFKELEILHTNNIQQNNIADILSTQEDIVLNIEKLIEGKEKELKEISHRLLSGQYRLVDNNGIISMVKNAEDNWQEVAVNGKNVSVPKGWSVDLVKNIIDIYFGSRVTKKEEKGRYPVFGSGKSSFFIKKYSHEKKWVISRFALSKNCVRFIEEKFWLLDSGFTFNSINNNETFLGYNFYYHQNDIYKMARGGAQQNLDMDLFKEYLVKLPSINEQKLIADFLSKQEKIIENLNKLLDGEKKKFEFLLDNLLSGKYLVEKIEENDQNTTKVE